MEGKEVVRKASAPLVKAGFMTAGGGRGGGRAGRGGDGAGRDVMVRPSGAYLTKDERNSNVSDARLHDIMSI